MKIDDLDEFRQALCGLPPRAGIIRQAVREFIDRYLEADPEVRRRFYEIKRGQSKVAMRGLRVVK